MWSFGIIALILSVDLAHSACNYVFYSVFPMLDGICQVNTLDDPLSTAMGKCSDDGESAMIYLYSDDDCSTLINVTNATYFSCNNTGTDCSGVEYATAKYNTTNCSGMVDGYAQFKVALVDNECVEFQGLNLNVTWTDDSVSTGLWSGDDCTGTYGTTFTTEPGCDDIYSYQFYPFQVTTTANPTPPPTPLPTTAMSTTGMGNGGSDSDSTKSLNGLIDTRLMIIVYLFANSYYLLIIIDVKDITVFTH